MEQLENGMVIGAAAEWERINDPIYDPATEDEALEYVDEYALGGQIVALYLELDEGTAYDEGAAVTLFEDLPDKVQKHLAKDFTENRHDFDEWLIEKRRRDGYDPNAW